MTTIDHIEAMIAQLQPEDLTGLPPARLRRLGDGLHIAEQWCRLAERQTGKRLPVARGGEHAVVVHEGRHDCAPGTLNTIYLPDAGNGRAG